VAAVEAAEEGKRNNTLNDEAFDLFAKFVPAGLLSPDDITAAMQAAAPTRARPQPFMVRPEARCATGAEKNRRSRPARTANDDEPA
jgi:hypothetical protein